MEHSDRVKEMIFLLEITELPNGLYHVRKCYRGGGRSKVLCCGDVDKCNDFVGIYTTVGLSEKSRLGMIEANMQSCKH